MKILISNDDGYRAEGLQALTRALQSLAEVTVVAPDRNRSGASNSLTLDVPLRVFEFEKNCYLVGNGTPTDCVHLAVTGLLEALPDIVVSGINYGANMGDDTIYSGTVAAATEGFLLGIPSFALPTSVSVGSVPVLTPELAILKSTRQRGFASIAFVAYWADTGELLASSGPFIGRTWRDDWWLFGTGPRTTGDIPPAQDPTGEK